MLQQNHKKTGILPSLAISLLLIVITSLFIIFRQRVVDQITVWQFHPTAEVSALVDKAGMNDNGKFYFLASKPILDGTKQFNTECGRVESVTSILGCYSNNHIYVYNVTDKQLDGIREVTAAHETLHAIYDRMSDSEKRIIDSLIEVEYKKLQGDKDFSDIMAFYARTEPGQRDNELHSIIGTEVANINPELEAHYNQFFKNRQSVVKLDVQYSSVFKGLKARADELEKQYNALSFSISVRTAQYNADAIILNNDITSFNQRASNGSFSSLSQFNSERYTLTSRAASLEATRQSINDDITKYKAILNEYNSIASESKKLYDVIDSNLAPSPSVK